MKKKSNENLEKCRIFGDRCIVLGKTSLKEKNATLHIKLNGDFIIYKIDGCLDSSTTTKKCDYIIINCERKEILYVELKGSDIKSACQQILSTYANFIGRGFISKAIIISSKVDKNYLQGRYYRDLKKNFGKNVEIRNREHTYN